ncbi:MAG: TIGR03960 family B12-binding radical SAM protein [Desulfobacterota bacterium]|nr:TIGR03960 family B12-binding radical SAM protein [Thermodesulfobacteriota bacterium]
MKTVMSFAEHFERLLPNVTKPARYLGNEINAVKKDHTSVDLVVCLAFPDVYEVGMSHLGLQILYYVLNRQPHIACERVFAPWPDMEELMRRHDLPLLTLESRIPVREVDILGFSLEYELCYATVLRMLAAARIPFAAAERDTSAPLVIAGGPCTYNPEPVAEFFDAFIIGEGEEVVLEVCEAVRSWRRSGTAKAQLLESLANIGGVYVPALFTPEYTASGGLQSVRPLRQGYTSITKRIITNFTDRPSCLTPIVPYVQTVHDRAQLEIARGCTRGCRFCMAGMIYRPIREKKADRLLKQSSAILAATGYEELSPVSLSAGDYAGINELVRCLIAANHHNRVAVSFPSLRVATLSPEMIHEIKRIRKTGFTIAPEAGTQRLRMVINKGITEDEIIETADWVFDAGWRLLKLYFMIGLPTEQEDDILAIVALCRKIAHRHRGRQLNVSVSTFVPKPHTPFQWEAQEHPERIAEKQHLLKRELHHGTIEVKYHDRWMSFLEGVFSRGDRRLGSVLVAAHYRGAGFDAWREYFNISLWMDAFRDAGCDPYVYLQERPPDMPLPWSHITCGISLDFLKREREKAYRGEPTIDCRQGECSRCGVCITPAHEIAASVFLNSTEENHTHNDTGHISVWVRCRYCKTDTARFLSHLELSRALARAIRRAGIPLAYSKGFHPLPRILFYHALPVGIEALGEIFDLELNKQLSLSDITTALTPHLPPGIGAEPIAMQIGRKFSPPPQGSTYRIFPCKGWENRWPPTPTLMHTIHEFEHCAEHSITFVRKGKAYTADLKNIVRRLTLIDHDSIEMVIDGAGKKTPHPADIACRIFKFDSTAVRVVKMPISLQEPAKTETN